MRTVVIITFGLFALGCKPTERSILGAYNKYSDFENWYTLKIKENYEFEFVGQEGTVGIWAQGRWNLTGDTLILNSHRNTKPSTIDLSETYTSNQLVVNVIDSDGQPIEGVYVSLINSGILIEKRTDANGRSTFPKNKYDSLDVGFVGYQQLKTRIPVDGSNEFRIKLMPDYNAFYQLENQILKVKWNRLIAGSLPSDHSKQVLRK